MQLETATIARVSVTDSGSQSSGRSPATPAPSVRPGASALRAMSLPPLILLGGEANALSVARQLGRRGVEVFIIGEREACVRHSRFCTYIPIANEGGMEASWARYLLSSESDHLIGAVLLSCSDAGIQVLSKHRERLQQRFQLDDSNPVAQIAMLDKLTTYRHAKAAGIPTPGFWEVSTRDQILALRPVLNFPLMIKPRLSHLFESRFGRKHIIVDSFDKLIEAYDSVSDSGMEVLLMEHIPGPDTRLSSYFTYLDKNGQPLFHFTKRVIRRFPTGMGAGCYHITDNVPEIIALSNKLFAHVGLRGVANVEFKFDDRDGQYKVIECNARFTASNSLVAASGCDIAEFVYNRITGRPQRSMTHYNRGMRLWDPLRDFAAFLELRRSGQITLWQWIVSVCHFQTFPYLQWSDPMPTLSRLFKPLLRRLPGHRAKSSKAVSGTTASVRKDPQT